MVYVVVVVVVVVVAVVEEDGRVAAVRGKMQSCCWQQRRTVFFGIRTVEISFHDEEDERWESFVTERQSCLYCVPGLGD